MNPIAFIMVAASVSILILGSIVFLSSPRRAAVIVLIIYVADTIWVGLPPVQIGLHIYAQDVLFALLLCAAMLRYMLGMARIERSRLAALTLLALVLLSTVRGIAAYGAAQAGVECRGFFWLFAGIVYFSSFGYSRKRIAGMIRLWQKGAYALIMIAVFRWIATGFHLPIAATWSDPYQPPMRVLDASAAMFLCVAFFFSLAMKASHTGDRWQQNLYYVIGPALILLQHRTIWVVTALGIMWMFRRNAMLLRRSLFAAGAAICAAAVFIASTFGLHFMIESLQQSATTDNTLIWRIAGWYQLVFLRTADTSHLLFGDAFGTGFARMIGNSDVVVGPHNFYVETYLRLGIVGLCLLVWFFVQELRTCNRLAALSIPAKACLNPRLWGLVIVSQMVYSITYNPGYEQSVIIGMIVGLNAIGEVGYLSANWDVVYDPLIAEPS